MKLYKKAKDPISFETHFIGAIGSLIVSIFMLIDAAIKNSNYTTYLSIIVFGVSSVALYTASSVYHYYQANDDNPVKKFLRKVDHSMIYVLIAGTYTPIVLTYLPQPNSMYFLIAIWAIAIIGIIVKLFWMNAPRLISTVVYLLMGWALVFDFSAFSAVPIGCMGLIAAGGLSYSIGALIYIIKKPNWFSTFGFHELFHIFVMIGTIFHFMAIFIFII